MSKIKEQLQRSQDLQMEYYTKFIDFVYDNLVNVELNEEEIDQLESSLPTNSTEIFREGMIPSFPLKHSNNIYYNDPIGA